MIILQLALGVGAWYSNRKAKQAADESQKKTWTKRRQWMIVALGASIVLWLALLFSLL